MEIEHGECVGCGVGIERRVGGAGRPREYCTPGCYQRARKKKGKPFNPGGGEAGNLGGEGDGAAGGEEADDSIAGEAGRAPRGRRGKARGSGWKDGQGRRRVRRPGEEESETLPPLGLGLQSKDGKQGMRGKASPNYKTFKGRMRRDLVAEGAFKGAVGEVLMEEFIWCVWVARQTRAHMLQNGVRVGRQGTVWDLNLKYNRRLLDWGEKLLLTPKAKAAAAMGGVAASSVLLMFSQARKADLAKRALDGPAAREERAILIQGGPVTPEDSGDE